jgi:hypothetical protein
VSERLRFGVAVFVVACLLSAVSAQLGSMVAADTVSCVSRGEYRDLQQGFSLSQVRNLFDGQRGRFELTPITPNFTKWSFNACDGWAPGKRVWCWFGVPDALLVKWALRDEPGGNLSANEDPGGDWT